MADKKRQMKEIKSGRREAEHAKEHDQRNRKRFEEGVAEESRRNYDLFFFCIIISLLRFPLFGRIALISILDVDIF